MGVASWRASCCCWRWLVLCGVFTVLHADVMQKANADLIVAYNSSTNPDILSASEVGVGVTALDLSRGSGITPETGTLNTFNSEGFTESTLVAAQTANDYLQWGWSTSTTPLNLTDLDIRYDRSSTGPDELAILLAVNGGEFQTFFTDTSVNANGENNLGIDLRSFTNVTSATFRLFAFGATSAAGTFDIENFQSSPGRGIVVNGVATPEPGVLTFLSVLGIVFTIYSCLRFPDSRKTATWSFARTGPQ
ncbi:MAG: hypothetical protein HYV60_11125 [Planctomycetia bacterium]|nr:hypothetical protein [Planctomycetia bacterium]